MMCSAHIWAEVNMADIKFLAQEKLNPYVAMIFAKQVAEDDEIPLQTKAEIFYEMELYDDVERLIKENKKQKELETLYLKNLIKKGDIKTACSLKENDERLDIVCSLINQNRQIASDLFEKYKQKKKYDDELFTFLMEKILYSVPVKYQFDINKVDAIDYFLIRYYQIDEILLPKDKKYKFKQAFKGSVFEDGVVDYDRLIQKWDARGISKKTQGQKIHLLTVYASAFNLKEKISVFNREKLPVVSSKKVFYPPRDIYSALVMLQKDVYSKEVFLMLSQNYNELLNAWLVEKVK